MELYSYFRSSASYRVRIALALKGIAVEYHSVHLLNDGGEQHAEDYRRINPAELVPSIKTEAGYLSQSLAIIEYLNELRPQPPLLPSSPWLRAQVRAFALDLCADCQPLVNLRVQQYLRGEGWAEEALERWLQHWFVAALTTCQARLGEQPEFCCCFADEPGLADVALVPALASAERFGVDLTPYPRLLSVYRHCRQLPAFARAAPENQPDAR